MPRNDPPSNERPTGEGLQEPRERIRMVLSALPVGWHRGLPCPEHANRCHTTGARCVVAPCEAQPPPSKRVQGVVGGKPRH
jgi:hypothetical protein